MTILIGSNVADLFFWCPGYGWGGSLKIIINTIPFNLYLVIRKTHLDLSQ